MIAIRLAESFHGGECVALDGELGAGKTQFVRGLVRGLGGEPHAVSSPTFVLLNVYPTPPLTVYHLDAFRVHGPQEFESIGFPELLEQPSAIIVVEWASRVIDLLPDRTIRVILEATAADQRRITIGPS